MAKHKVYVTRDASVTYVAEVDLTLEEIEARCGKHGFDDGDLTIEWEDHSINVFDNVEIYQITHQEHRMINNVHIEDEVTDQEWYMN